MSKYVCNMSKCMHNITNFNLLHILAYIEFRICTLKTNTLKQLKLSASTFENETIFYFINQTSGRYIPRLLKL